MNKFVLFDSLSGINSFKILDESIGILIVMTFLNHHGLQLPVFAEPFLQFLFDLVGGFLGKRQSYVDFEIRHEDLVGFQFLLRLR